MVFCAFVGERSEGTLVHTASPAECTRAQPPVHANMKEQNIFVRAYLLLRKPRKRGSTFQQTTRVPNHQHFCASLFPSSLDLSDVSSFTRTHSKMKNPLRTLLPLPPFFADSTPMCPGGIPGLNANDAVW